MQCTVQARPFAAARMAPRAPISSTAFKGTSRLSLARLGLQGRSPRRQVTRMGLFGLGVPELAVIAGVTALLFGPSKLPELGKSLGKMAKSFQSAAKEFEKELKEAAAEAPPAASAAEKKEEEQQKPE